MGFNRLAPALVAGALGVAGFGTAASAADLLVKAPPPPPIVELDMQLENGKVSAYRAKVKVSFKY